jgi:hypothetical protein
MAALAPHLVKRVPIFAPQPEVAVEHSNEVVCTEDGRRP